MLNIAMSKFLTNTFVDTLAPASRHTPGGSGLQSSAPSSQHSRDCARRPVVAKHFMETATSACLAARGMGKRNRRNNRFRNGWGSKWTSLDNIALFASDKDGTTLVNTNEVFVHLDAICCNPCLGWWMSPSSMGGSSNRKPAARSSHVGLHNSFQTMELNSPRWPLLEDDCVDVEEELRLVFFFLLLNDKKGRVQCVRTRDTHLQRELVVPHDLMSGRNGICPWHWALVQQRDCEGLC